MDEYSTTVGAVQILALSDMNVAYPMPLGELWPEVGPEEWARFQEEYPDTFEGDRMRLEIGCYLVRSNGRVILIDTGYGPGPVQHIGGLRGRLMAELAAAKVRPDEVDTVVLSHLHLDHVGWNTADVDGKAVPTFPKARYLAHDATQVGENHNEGRG